MDGKRQTTKKGERVLARIRKTKPLVEGSFTVTRKRCGNPKCRCTREGPIHETALLTWKEGGRTRTLYVPKDARKEVAQWVKESKKLKGLIKELSEEQRKLLRKRRKGRKG
jgi:hypothetical protein